jgi:alpha-amylase/alpha-mannosidase (GH57 family)
MDFNLTPELIAVNEKLLLTFGGRLNMFKLPVLFGLHNHQPLGNFHQVIERLTDTCYRPFLQAVSKASWFSFSLHVSGTLLSWWEDNDTSIIDLIGSMADEGQVELLGGGFYEPVLASISREDRKEQILKLSEYLEERFGQRPKGLWLTERVWENQIIEDLIDSAIQFVIVDDRHFLVTGFNKEDLHGYYLTESGGKTMAVFPIDETLRYFIPFLSINELETYLRQIAARGKMAIYVDDGEKFGAWPGTHKWVYEDGWLENFLESAFRWKEEFIDWTTFSQVMDRVPASGICYLPDASYEEMEQWALPAGNILKLQELIKSLGTEAKEVYSPFLRGGHWKNFFVKYPESNHMHKRTAALSRMSLNTRLPDRQARDCILSAQCNDAYWHGIFGGLYLPHLRNAVWQSILKAEARLRRRQDLLIEKSDINKDGLPEVIVSSGDACLVFEPHSGGQLVEFSLLDPPNNYGNALTRRPEAYHQILRKTLENGTYENNGELNEGVSSIHKLTKALDHSMLDELIYDWYRRNSFIDHLFDSTVVLGDFKRCDFREWGDFVNQPYEYSINSGTLVLVRDGGLYMPGYPKRPVRLTKSFIFKDRGLTITAKYVLKNVSADHIDCRFGIEWNIFPAFLALGNGKILVEGQERNFRSPWEQTGNKITFVDQAINAELHIELGQNSTIWGFPVNTVTRSESGYEKTTQAISIMAHQELRLNPGEEWQQGITWQVETAALKSVFYPG